MWLQYQYDAHQDSRARQKFIFHQPLHHDVVNETSKHLQNKRCGSVLHCTAPSPRWRGQGPSPGLGLHALLSFSRLLHKERNAPHLSGLTLCSTLSIRSSAVASSQAKPPPVPVLLIFVHRVRLRVKEALLKVLLHSNIEELQIGAVRGAWVQSACSINRGCRSEPGYQPATCNTLWAC